MKKKNELPLNENEMIEMCAMHKKMMQAVAEHTPKNFGENATFLITTYAISFTISSIMSTFGLDKVTYAKDILEFVSRIHEDAHANSSYMEYKNGKKVSEGKFN